MKLTVRPTAFSSLCCAAIALAYPILGLGQGNPALKQNIPVELRAADPQIQNLLEEARNGADNGDIDEAITKATGAYQIAVQKQLLGDAAIAEAALASGYLAKGKLPEWLNLLHKGLQDASDSGNLVLEADILTSISVEAQIKGDWQGAIEIVRKAADRADRAHNLYEKSRALGMLGYLQLLSGKTEEARIPIENALEIDRINQYAFIAPHLLYQGYYLIATGKLDASAELLNQASEKAIEHSDLISFVLAKNALANVYVRKGEASEAIQLLESIRQGKFDSSETGPEINRKLVAALSAPLPRISLLEGLGAAYEFAEQPEKALPVWEELYSFSQGIDLLAAKAEAAKKVADLNAQLKRTQEALSSYSAAVPLLRHLQNEPLLLQALISESLLLVQAGKGQEALPLAEEVVELAKGRKTRPLEFLAYLQMAEIYQPTGDLANAKAALEKAQALVEAGPSDPEIDNKSLLEAYNRLGDIYREQHDTPKELIEAEKGFEIARLLKDEDAEANLAEYIRRRFEETNIYGEAQKAESEGRLEDALVLSEIIFAFDGVPAQPDIDPNWSRVLNLPSKVVQRPDGPKVLTEIVNDMGSFLGNPRYVILDVLSRYYVVTGARPDLAEHFALELEAAMTNAEDSSLFLKIAAACDLTLAYAHEGKGALATGKATECMSMAAKSNQQQTKDFANAANVMAHVAADDLGNAEDSLEELIAKLPAPAEPHVLLAIALANRRLYRQARAELEKASQAYATAGDKKSAASSFMRVAIALSSDASDDGEKEQLACLQAANKLYRESGDVGGESDGELLMGEHYLGSGDNSAAVEHLGKSYVLAEEAKRSLTMASAETDLGTAYQNLKDFSKAAKYHQRASEAAHHNHNAVLETTSLVSLGKDQVALHEPEKALESFLEAKQVAAPNVPVFTKYLVDMNLGNLYREEGEFDQAMAAFRDAEDTTKEGQDLEHLAYSHLAVAGLDELLGYWEDSASKSDEALGIFKTIQNTEGQSAASAELVDIYGDRSSSVKDFDKALGYYEEAERLGYGPRLQLDLLEIYLQTGRYPEAVKAGKEGLKACLKDHDSDCQANALLSLAEAERKSGDLKDGRSDTDRAGPLATRSKDVYLQGRFLYGEANQERAEGHFETAFSSYKKLILLIETAKGQGDTRTQRGLEETYGYVYDELTSTVHSMYRKKTASEGSALASQALEYAEANKARQFAESWGRAFISEMRRALPAELQETEHSLLSKRQKSALVASGSILTGGSQDNAKQRTEDLSSVNKDIEGFVAKLRRSNPQYATVAYPEPISIESLPLRRGETLVECKVTEDSTFVWIVRNSDGQRNDLVSFYEVARPRSWFLERASILRNGLNSDKPETIDWTISEQLFAALFPENIAKEIVHSQAIIFVPDDVLFLLPFELLSPGASKSEFVFLNIPTRYYPSAAALRLGRSAQHSGNWQEAFLGIGDPITSPQDERYDIASVLSSETPPPAGADQKAETPHQPSPDLVKIKSRGFAFDRLPATAKEIKDIAALFEASHDTIEVRLGPEATKDKVLNTDLSTFRFLHFATHGILPVDTDIKEPSLVLSYDGTGPERMLLSMSEILALHIQADSVVLSACNTGSGNVSRAEGVMSLGRAFSAGASSVTVSLWQVSDESTALFMEEFYRNLLAGKSKDVALATSRAALFERGYKQPFFWAPFVLIGE